VHEIAHCSTAWRWSMKTRLLYSVIAAVFMLAAALALGAAAQLGTVVVCVGSDGHTDVESSICTCSCCTVTSSHDERVHSGLVPASPSCSDCVDVPLRAAPLKSKESRFLPPNRHAKGLIRAQCCGGGCKNDLLVPVDYMDQHWQSLSSLSTVVLLT